MKHVNEYLIIIILICCIIIYKIVDTKITTSSKEIKQEIVTPINIEVKEIAPLVSSSNMPSYCKPESYKIIKINDIYRIQLPGGTLFSDSYKTAEEAYKEIVITANHSKKRYIESGGLEF